MRLTTQPTQAQTRQQTFQTNTQRHTCTHRGVCRRKHTNKRYKYAKAGQYFTQRGKRGSNEECGHGNEHERSWEGIPTLGSFVFNILPIWRAIRVFPVPGGPYSRIPLTCLMPNLRMVSGGYILEAKARRKVAASSWSRPPIPSFSKENSMRKGRMLGDRPVCVGVCDERERASNENICRQNTHVCRQHTHACRQHACR